MGRRSSRVSSKTEFWEKHINAWLDSGLTQAHYCHEHGLSKSSFSKWKVKLQPKSKGKRKSYRQKSDYFKFTKLSEKQTETLIRYFVYSISAKTTAKAVGISAKSVYNHHEKLRLAQIDGALNYPQLFFGSGMLLLLGPPQDYIERLVSVRKFLPGTKGKIHSTKQRQDILRDKIIVLYQMQVYYSIYKWSLPEIFLFKEMGYSIFYQNIYSIHHKLDKNRWDDELKKELYQKISPAIVARANWDHWAGKRKREPFIPIETWQAIFYRREAYAPEYWFRQILHDLKWVLKSHNVGKKRGPRKSYWDEFNASKESVIDAYTELTDKWKKVTSGYKG